MVRGGHALVDITEISNNVEDGQNGNIKGKTHITRGKENTGGCALLFRMMANLLDVVSQFVWRWRNPAGQGRVTPPGLTYERGEGGGVTVRKRSS